MKCGDKCPKTYFLCRVPITKEYFLQFYNQYIYLTLFKHNMQSNYHLLTCEAYTYLSTIQPEVLYHTNQHHTTNTTTTPVHHYYPTTSTLPHHHHTTTTTKHHFQTRTDFSSRYPPVHTHAHTHTHTHIHTTVYHA